MDKIVKMTRSEGNTLTRMKSEYVPVSQDQNTATILVPNQEALLRRRMGKDIVTDISSPSDVVTALALSVVPAANIPAGGIHDDAVVNQAAATLTKVDDSNYGISADFSALKKYSSTDPNQVGEHLWLAVAVATGETTIVGLKFDGSVLDAGDVEDATDLGLAAGTFVLWLKLENMGRTIAIGNGDKETTVKITVVNTEA